MSLNMRPVREEWGAPTSLFLDTDAVVDLLARVSDSLGIAYGLNDTDAGTEVIIHEGGKFLDYVESKEFTVPTANRLLGENGEQAVSDVPGAESEELGGQLAHVRGFGGAANPGGLTEDLKGEPMLTREQKRKYVECGGVRCPYCQSQELEAGQGEFDADFAWVTVTCADCGKEWHDGFHLATINPLDEQGRPMLDDDEEEGVGLEVQ